MGTPRHEVDLVGPPFALRIRRGTTMVLGPPEQPGGGLGFQTTASVGSRRWRTGPVQWEPGPENADPPPDGGWWRASELVDLDRGDGFLAARLATDDPEGRMLIVEVTAADHLVVRVGVDRDPDGVEVIGVGFAAGPTERWLGFGERADRVVRWDGTVENYVSDGPWQEYEYPFLEATVPRWAVRQRPDSTYFPVPWAVSTSGVGVAVDNDAPSYLRLRPGGAPRWSVEAEDSELRLRIFPEDHPLTALGHYTVGAGRQAAPEPWWWGPWYQSGHANHVPLDEERGQLDRLRAARAPVSAVETHCRYLPVGEHRGHEQAEADRVAQLHDAGLAVLSYLNPLVSVDFPEAFDPADDDRALLRRAAGGTYTFEAYAGGREPPVTLETHYDFTGPAAAGHWAVVARSLVEAGYDGWMEDFGEYTPLDAVLADGAPAGPAGHNRYVTAYHGAAAAVTADLERGAGRRLARFVRSGWTGTAAVAPIVWGGDPTTGWGFNGLASAIIEGLSAGASGVAMWGSDIGGFVSSVDHLTPELLQRWIQFGACSPVMRTKAGGIQGPDVVRPQIWDEGIIDGWVRWAAWHTQLNPYLAAAHDRYRRTGRPVMVALALAHPDDAAGVDIEDEYLFGPDLLVAPVIEDGARTRALHLPPGGWVDLWRAAAFDPATRAIELAGGARLLTGPGGVSVPAPLNEIPVLVRAGAVLPLLSAEVDTLAPYRADGVVNAVDREDRRRLLCFTSAGTWSGAIGPGEPVESSVGDGTWHLDLAAVPVRRYDVHADLGLLAGGAPSSVEVAGPDRWDYDPATGVLRAEAGATDLTVRLRRT